MIIAGIVAEYNPFHNGHKYQIEETRKAGATHIICVMSGAAVQRGDIAIYSKYERARSAVKNGADLVIELPCPYSCSNGEVFARAAVSILSSFGENVVDRISFGCEEENIDLLKQAANASLQMKQNDDIKEYMKNGMSYPLALNKSIQKNYNENISSVFKHPNNVLAIEYLKAVKEFAPWIKPFAVSRKGSFHDSMVICDNIASATNVRSCIKNNKAVKNLIPYLYNDKPAFIDNSDKLLLYKCLTVKKSELLELPDVDENIANRFIKSCISNPSSILELEQRIKSKNITMARIRRMILQLVLGVKKDDIKSVPYSRILAFNKRGREILSVIKNNKIPIGTSLKKLESASEYGLRVSSLERKAVCLQDLSKEGIINITNEYTQKIQIQE